MKLKNLRKQELLHILTDIIGETKTLDTIRECRTKQLKLQGDGRETWTEKLSRWDCRTIANKLGL